MPLMVEPLAFDPGEAGYDSAAATSTASAGVVRQAVELGADVIKADPTDDLADYHRVVTVARVPLLVRGGGRVTDREILERTHAVLEQGAAGIVYGRNVIQHDNPAGDDAGADGGRARGRDARAGARHLTLAMSVVRIGIVGGGLMGRELAAAIGRWAALEDHPVQPRLEAVCDTSAGGAGVVRARSPTVRTLTDDRRRAARGPRPRRPLPRGPAPPARGALPRGDRGRQGLPGREAVRDRPRARRGGSSPRSTAPDVFARCSSEMPYFPGAQLAYEHDPLGRARADDRGRARVPALERPRPRQADQLEAPGALLRRASGSWTTSACTSLHLPLRLGWRPRARLRGAAGHRARSGPGPTASPSRCDTWDNATLHADAAASRSRSRRSGSRRGRRNTWRLRALGMDGGVDFSTGEPEGVPPLRGARRPPAVGAPRDRQPVGVRDGHRARSSSSASPTRSCRCGPPSSPSARARSATASAASRPPRRSRPTSCSPRRRLPARRARPSRCRGLSLVQASRRGLSLQFAGDSFVSVGRS